MTSLTAASQTSTQRSHIHAVPNDYQNDPAYLERERQRIAAWHATEDGQRAIAEAKQKRAELISDFADFASYAGRLRFMAQAMHETPTHRELTMFVEALLVWTHRLRVVPGEGVKIRVLNNEGVLQVIAALRADATERGVKLRPRAERFTAAYVFGDSWGWR